MGNSCFLSARLAVLFGESKKSALCQIYTCARTVCGSQSARAVRLQARLQQTASEGEKKNHQTNNSKRLMLENVKVKCTQTYSPVL